MTHDTNENIITEADADEIMAKYDRETNVRQFTDVRRHIITGLFLLFTAYVFWTTIFVTLPEQVRRSAFVGILVFIGYLLFPAKRSMTREKAHIAWFILDIILGALGAIAFFYYVLNFREIINRAAILQPMDIYMGLMGIILVAELCRRVVGLPIVIVAGGFVAYAFLQGYSLRRIIHQLFYTTDGIIGTPIAVVSTFIVLFIFLASFLEKSGIANFFINLANSVAGWTAGGPAKVAVIASALMGMISGSSVANTVGSGSVTIPTMKKTGYRPEFAAAVEASASTGGQIMPPIMGAAAFLMAEMTGIPYITIVVSAIIPAVLYFAGIFLAVHFEAKKLKLKGLPKDEMPKIGHLLLSQGYLFLPIVILITVMGMGRTPALAACYAILASYVVSLFRKETRITPKGLVEAFCNGSRNTLGVAIACAMAGTIVGVVSLTGIGQTLIGALLRMVNNPFLVATGLSLFVALFFTMISSLILGMGVPTTAKYIIMATIAAPMIIRAGNELGIAIPILAAHMFVFYFGLAADITPPVALAAYAGAAIANANPMKSGVIAVRLAIAAFIVPYVFIYNPGLLLIEASFFNILQAIFSTSQGMILISIGLAGYFFKSMNLIWRVIAIIGGFMGVHHSFATDIIGLAIFVLLIVVQLIEKRNEKALSLK